MEWCYLTQKTPPSHHLQQFSFNPVFLASNTNSGKMKKNKKKCKGKRGLEKYIETRNKGEIK